MNCPKKIVVLMMTFSLISILLSGCGKETVDYADVPQQYVKTLDYHDDFVIVQLTDIHWNTATAIGNDSYGSRAYLLSLADEIKNNPELFMKQYPNRKLRLESLKLPHAA